MGPCEVAAGQSLLVVEAMKMEHVISAPHAGTVAEL
ncbi:biotin/lipoyl-containing protein, partial [Streptomyces pathocidini]